MTDRIQLVTMDLVQVVWRDACHARSPEDAAALKMMSFGMLLKRDSDGLLLAQSQSDVGEFIDCLYIPAGNVVDVVPIPVPSGKGDIR